MRSSEIGLEAVRRFIGVPNDISLVTQKLVTQEDAKYSAAERANFLNPRDNLHFHASSVIYFGSAKKPGFFYYFRN